MTVSDACNRRTAQKRVADARMRVGVIQLREWASYTPAAERTHEANLLTCTATVVPGGEAHARLFGESAAWCPRGGNASDAATEAPMTAVMIPSETAIGNLPSK